MSNLVEDVPIGEIEQLWKDHSYLDKGRMFMKVVVHYSVAKTYKQAVREWTGLTVGCATGDIESRCACGKEITSEYFVRNRHTGAVLKVGCVCVLKFSSRMLQDQLAILRKEKAGGVKGICASCIIRRVPVRSVTMNDVESSDESVDQGDGSDVDQGDGSDESVDQGDGSDESVDEEDTTDVLISQLMCDTCKGKGCGVSLGYRELKFRPCTQCKCKNIPPNAPVSMLVCGECRG